MSADLPRRTAHPSATPVAPPVPAPATNVPPGPIPGNVVTDLHPASHAIESRWVPLIPGAQAIPTGVSTRSGAFLMAATRDELGLRSAPRAVEPDLDVRSALVTCLEALAPYLEPGWSHCQEHAGCLAVQEASRALWGRPSAAAASTGPMPIPLGRASTEAAPPDAANLPLPGPDDGPESPNSPLMSRPAPSGPKL